MRYVDNRTGKTIIGRTHWQSESYAVWRRLHNRQAASQAQVHSADQQEVQAPLAQKGGFG